MSVTSPPTRLRSNSARQRQTTITLNAIARPSLKLKVVLLQRNSKQPGKFGGGVLDKGHTWEITADAGRVREHLRRGGNIGFICGPHTDLMVLDIDDPERFKALVAVLGEPGRPWVETGSGKRHYYLKWEPGLPAKLTFEGKIIGEIQRGPTTKDGESKQQEEFLTAVHDWRGEQSFEARELADDFRQGNLDPNCLPSDIADSLSKPSFGKMLGRAFGKKKEARSEEYRIVRVSPGTKSKKAVRWKIVREAEEGV